MIRYAAARRIALEILQPYLDRGLATVEMVDVAAAMIGCAAIQDEAKQRAEIDAARKVAA